MTTQADWKFRAEYLRAQADCLDNKAAELNSEAKRYRQLADWSEHMSRVPDDAP